MAGHYAGALASAPEALLEAHSTHFRGLGLAAPGHTGQRFWRSSAGEANAREIDCYCSPAGTRWSAAGAGDEGGDDVGGVAVEGLAASVVAHGGAGISMAGSLLHIPQRYAGIEGGSDERVAEAVATCRFSIAATYLPSRKAGPVLPPTTSCPSTLRSLTSRPPPAGLLASTRSTPAIPIVRPGSKGALAARRSCRPGCRWRRREHGRPGR
jgi:hypothetical protein